MKIMSDVLFNGGQRIEVPLPETHCGYRAEAWQQYSHAMNFEIFENQDSEPTFSGSIKWDGCSNWNCQVIHFCEREWFVEFAHVLEICFDFTAANLSTFDD